MDTVTVNIFGTDYKIKTDVTNSYLEKIARIVDSKMREVQHSYPQPSTTKVCVLTCINLVDELLRREEEKDTVVKNRLTALLKKLDTVV
jgi:cell division protein ZapA